MVAPTVGTNRTLGVENATSNSKFLDLRYTANTVTQKVFIAPIAVRVTAIQGVPRVAGSGGACTFTFLKTADTVVPTSGTSLSGDSFNVAGTADINQYLTLVTNVDSLTLQPGDALSMVLTGTPTSAVGVVTVTLEPVN